MSLSVNDRVCGLECNFLGEREQRTGLLEVLRVICFSGNASRRGIPIFGDGRYRVMDGIVLIREVVLSVNLVYGDLGCLFAAFCGYEFVSYGVNDHRGRFYVRVLCLLEL